MLAGYHMLFLAASLIGIVITLIFLFVLEKTKLRLLGASILIGINLGLCQISWLGFFGVEFIAIDSNNNFLVYTYPDMYGLYAFSFFLWIINIILAIVVWSFIMRRIWEEAGAVEEKSPLTKTDPYWKT